MVYPSMRFTELRKSSYDRSSPPHVWSEAGGTQEESANQPSRETQVSTRSGVSESPGFLVLDPTSQSPWGLRMFISNKFPAILMNLCVRAQGWGKGQEVRSLTQKSGSRGQGIGRPGLGPWTTPSSKSFFTLDAGL